MFYEIPFDEVTEADIQRLVENRVRESIRLDFKRDLPDRKDKSKKDFLKDVTAFANSVGGDLLYGVDEDDESVASEVVGLQQDGFDEARTRMLQLMRTSIDPPLQQFRFREFKFENGMLVLHIRICQSHLAPHMVQFSNHRQFHLRHPDGNSPMDTSHVRNAVLRSANWRERVEDWRTERLKGARPANALRQAALFFLHLVPLQEREAVFWGRENLRRLGERRLRAKFTFDGLMIPHRNAGSYELWDERGRLEAGCGSQLADSTDGLRFEYAIARRLQDVLQAPEIIRPSRPIALSLSLRIRSPVELVPVDRFYNGDPVIPLQPDFYWLGSRLLTDEDVDIWRILASPLSRMWNIGGYAGSPYYRQETEVIERFDFEKRGWVSTSDANIP